MAWFRCMGDTSGLKNQIASLNSQISNLNSQIAQKDQTITNLQNQINAAPTFVCEATVESAGGNSTTPVVIRRSDNYNPVSFTIGKKYAIFLHRKYEDVSAGSGFQNYVDGLTAVINRTRVSNGTIDSHRASLTVFAGTATKSNIYVKNEDNVCYGFVIML